MCVWVDQDEMNHMMNSSSTCKMDEYQCESGNQCMYRESYTHTHSKVDCEIFLLIPFSVCDIYRYTEKFPM